MFRSLALLLAALISGLAAPNSYSTAVSEDTAGMVLLPAGEFLMGTDEGEKSTNASPAHMVKLDAFWIDRYEVTNRRYEKFIKAGGYTKQEYWSKDGREWLAKSDRKLPKSWEAMKAEGEKFLALPVTGVSFYEAEAFARFEGKRLPTEQEWERAARGTDGRAFPWGNNLAEGMAKLAEGERHKVKAIGSNPADVSADGIFDLGGNVSEWTSTLFGPYPKTKFVSRYWKEGASPIRVARGSSYHYIARGELSADQKCRTTYRLIRHHQTSAYPHMGFRCAKDHAAKSD